MSGKGSKQRPTNLNSFEANFERIFGKPKQVCDNERKPKEVKEDANQHDK